MNVYHIEITIADIAGSDDLLLGYQLKALNLEGQVIESVRDEYRRWPQQRIARSHLKKQEDQVLSLIAHPTANGLMEVERAGEDLYTTLVPVLVRKKLFDGICREPSEIGRLFYFRGDHGQGQPERWRKAEYKNGEEESRFDVATESGQESGAPREGD